MEEKVTLYDLGDGYYNILEMLNSMENPENDEEFGYLFEALDQMNDEASHKIENIAKIIQQYENYKLVLKNEIDRLRGRSKGIDSKIKWLKSYVQRYMEISNQKVIETPLFRVLIANNGGVLPLIYTKDFNEIPDEYFNFYKTDTTINSKMLREELDEEINTKLKETIEDHTKKTGKKPTKAEEKSYKEQISSTVESKFAKYAERGKSLRIK